MPDPTPDVTTTPNFDPGRVAIASGWLVYDVGYHTCGGYGPESGYAHEPGCGAEPMCKVADIPDLLAALVHEQMTDCYRESVSLVKPACLDRIQTSASDEAFFRAHGVAAKTGDTNVFIADWVE